MEEERENDIIKDSYYLINLFHNDNKEITQLHVQKLMFLFEAYYMNVMDVSKLYDCGYKAWNFGPVATKLYKKYKKYGKEDIKLTDEQVDLGNNSMSDEKKQIMENLYEVFKDYSPMQLVSFTHAKNSPWRKVWEKNQYGDISKESIKNWFKKYVKSKEKR